MPTRHNVVVRLALLIFILAQTASSRQEPTEAVSDPFQQQAGGVVLKEQSIVDGVAILSQSVGLPVSVEFPLGPTISGPAPPLRTFSTNIASGTVTEVLDRLCALDPTFTWMRNGSMANFLPSALAKDPQYIFNRKLSEATFQDVKQAPDAVMTMVGQLPGAREQLAVLQEGVPLDFPRPWNTTLKNVTVREIANQIARQLGSSYGWQLSGAADFRMITFHEGLLPRPSRGKQSPTTQ
jgi:hypothetical protein